MHSELEYSERRDLPSGAVLALYRANGWSAAEKPEALLNALRSSHAVVTAWQGERLVGLGNAISDGHLVVYYPHMLVHPQHHGQGVGRAILERLRARYEGFHQHVLIAVGDSVRFYERCGFNRADRTHPMWIFAGDEH